MYRNPVTFTVFKLYQTQAPSMEALVKRSEFVNFLMEKYEDIFHAFYNAIIFSVTPIDWKPWVLKLVCGLDGIIFVNFIKLFMLVTFGQKKYGQDMKFEMHLLVQMARRSLNNNLLKQFSGALLEE